MRKVIGIGETVLDIIFKNGQPIGAYPGGSTFNAIVSLGRSGVSTKFISETGHDRVGEYIINFLKENGVDPSNVNIFPESKSPISLAFLNDNNDAEYIFYKDHPHDQLDFVYPDIQPDDIVVFGSYYAVNPVIRPQVTGSPWLGGQVVASPISSSSSFIQPVFITQKRSLFSFRKPFAEKAPCSGCRTEPASCPPMTRVRNWPPGMLSHEPSTSR